MNQEGVKSQEAAFQQGRDAMDSCGPADKVASASSIKERRTHPLSLLRCLGGLVPRFEAALLGLLLGNLSLLLVGTMPQNYFFGLKAGVLNFLARSLLYRVIVRTLPLVIIGGSGYAVLSKQQGSIMQLLLANGLLAYVQSRWYELIRGDPRPVLSIEARAEEREMLSWEPPSVRTLNFLTTVQRQLMPAALFGQELLPTKRERLLFVGNHGIWGLDVSVLLHTLYTKEGIFPRSFGSHAWFAVPVMDSLVKAMIGAVDGTSRNCDLLMQAGHNCLVYPGGEREAWKKTSDKKYSLIWGESRGFARMALRHKYIIIPVAAVGTEDIFEVAADLPLSKILRLGGMIPAPSSKKVAGNALMDGTTLPLIMPQIGKLQRLYFKLGKPIKASPSTFIDGFYSEQTKRSPLGPRQGSLRAPGLESFEPSEDDVCALRDKVREAIEADVEWLLSYRNSDPNRYTGPSLMRPASEVDSNRGQSRL